MSDDGISEPYSPDYEETSIEIIVETLTGTTFEMTVSPIDSVMSIKSKIQRVEGIPVSQQHLLYRMKELNNDEKLCDHGVTAGNTLQLVLSMRGGPISTRRLASSEHHLAWRELKEYVDNTREDMIDKLPPGSKVTVLVFREGDNINLIRVIENEDGTCYPYSDNWPQTKPTSKEPQTKHRERNNENNLLMHKVSELRRKMEGLSMQKKAKRPATDEKFDCEPTPSTSEINNEYLNVNLQSENSRLMSDNGDHVRVGKSLSEIYSDRLLLLEQRRNNRTNIGRSHRPHRVESGILTSKSDEMALSGRNCAIQAPSIAILEEEPEQVLNKKESDFPAPISVASGDANTVTMSQIPGTSRNLIHLAHMAHVVLKDPTERPKTSPEKYDPKAREFCNVVFNDAAERSHNSHNSVKLSVSNRRQSLDFTSNKTNLPRMQFASSSNPRIDTLDKNFKDNSDQRTDWPQPGRSDWQQPTFSRLFASSSNPRINTLDKNYKDSEERSDWQQPGRSDWQQPAFSRLFASSSNPRIDTLDKNYKENSEQRSDWQQPTFSRLYNTSSNLLTSQYASTSKLNSAHLDNVLGNRVTESSNSKFNNERRSPLYGRRARIERIRNNIAENSNSDKYGYSNLGYIANIEKIQNDSVSNMSINKQTPQYGRRNVNFVSNLEARTSCDPTTYELRPYKLPRRRPDAQTETEAEPKNAPKETSSQNSTNSKTLPPITPKKNARTRCGFCNKRLNITNIHTCRCGGIFCAQHRYSEVHGCQYDYKTEGKKILEQANPVVAATKLPKI